MNNIIKKLTSIALCLAFGVILLGAYTRLTDAGLGCPDWPGCYGKLFVSQNTNFTNQTEITQAWTEMVHRYFAGTLGLLIICITILSYRASVRSIFPYFLFLLVCFQAALGMWTVTLKLFPVVVMGHLLGGMLIFGGLIYFRWQQNQNTYPLIEYPTQLINIGILLVFIQIALGGWVSSNYAALGCIGFPTCNGAWLPKLDFQHAFEFFSPTNLNYQGGRLDSTSRTTIHMMHRFGAVITVTYLSGLFVHLYRRTTHAHHALRGFILCTTLLLILQIMLGVINVVYLLPLSVAVLHNGVAASIFACMLSLRYLAGRAH
jgi:heme a synthase